MWWMYPPPMQQNGPAFMDKFMEKVLEEYLKDKNKKSDDDKKDKDTPLKLNVVEVASFMMLVHVPIIWVLVWSWLSR